jgi:DNA/RNA-binding domain of Phe-tRNA-synthetase-like protein
VKFKIEHDIFERFPGLNVGIVIAGQINNKGRNDELMGLIREKEKEILAEYDSEALSQYPRIEAWRKAYLSFGAKPKKYKSSVESLCRMVLKGTSLRHINKIVDIYNYVSIKYMIPVGGDDLAKVDGDIRLKFARGDEPFIPLNSREEQSAKTGEVVYVDEREVLCRRWNWRECDKTKMTEETKDVVLVCEGLPPFTQGEIQEIVEDLSGMLKNYCGGMTETVVLNQTRRQIEI